MSLHERLPVRLLVVWATLAAFAVTVASASPPKLVLGAVYPTGGSHAQGGIDEYRGVLLAVEYVNARGGVNGRAVEVVLEPADAPDRAPAAVAALARRRVPVVLGSYGSNISQPAADAARARGLVFWETGAVGDLSMASTDDPLVFRFPPTGETLGRAAVEHAVDRAIPLLGRNPARLRYGVTYVDDVYGRSVGNGALAEIRDRGLRLAGTYPYSLASMNLPALVRQMKHDGVQVLFVSSYLADGIEMRRQMVRQQLALVASVGTSSSYCMHEFGEALGADAVGLYASDKPDGHVLDPARLDPDAGERLAWARETFATRFAHEMTAPALTGFAGAIALLEHVIPAAASTEPRAIAEAARTIRVPQGALPNGSGLDFPDAGRGVASENLEATSVIWQWVAPGVRAVVHPPAFASRDALPLGIA